MFDIDGPWGRRGVDPERLWTELLPKLRNYESMTWHKSNQTKSEIMKLSDIPTPELRRILKATQDAAGPESVEVEILRREIVRRELRNGVARRKSKRNGGRCDMMPYIIGQDPETNEILVGDRRNNVLFLRGPATAETQIRDLVQAANQWCHEQAWAAGAKREGEMP